MKITLELNLESNEDVDLYNKERIKHLVRLYRSGDIKAARVLANIPFGILLNAEINIEEKMKSKVMSKEEIISELADKIRVEVSLKEIYSFDNALYNKITVLLDARSVDDKIVLYFGEPDNVTLYSRGKSLITMNLHDIDVRRLQRWLDFINSKRE